MESTDVRSATFDVLRRHDMTTLFGNPGSTEVHLLSDLPADIRFVLALHEGSVVGMATGWAIAHDRPAAVILHTTAGLGNAVGALATARVNRAPLVVLVGQQDRRHLAAKPFLAGDLDGLAGNYPVRVDRPVRAADVPGAVARAWHEATGHRGPALVIVPQDDWAAPAETDLGPAAPLAVRRAGEVPEEVVTELAGLLDEARSPAIVTGAGTADEETWTALVTLAERLDCPVWQEAFGARPGFPQDHPLFAGHLPAGRSGLRETLTGRDLVLVVGAPVFRQYQFEPGPMLPPGTRAALITEYAGEAHRSPVELAVVGRPGPVCERLAHRLAPRTATAGREDPTRLDSPRRSAEPPAEGEPLRAGHVFSALAVRLAPDAVVIEETPSSRQRLERMMPARSPLGFVSAAMGGLGFALPAAVGLKMALPARPVVAVAGDGSALYGIQALWSAAHYGIGALFIVLANGRYAVLDRLAEARGGKPSWPPFSEVSVAALATGLGVPARRITSAGELEAVLDDVVPGLGARTEPLLLDVAVEPDPDFNP